MHDLVFREYIHLNLFREETALGSTLCCPNSFKISDKKPTSEKCFCIPIFIYNSTCKFFAFKQTKCSCPIFGTGQQVSEIYIDNCIGYSLYDCLSLNGKSKSTDNLRKLFLMIPNLDTPTKKIYAIVLCSYFGQLLKDYVDLNEYVQHTIYTTMIDNIKNAYFKDKNTESDIINELMCQVYFYICFCVRGNGTFNNNELINFYKGIMKYSCSAAVKIRDNLKTVMEESKKGKSYLDIMHEDENEKNYLACVCELLRSFVNKNPMIPKDFYAVLDHFNIAFSPKPSGHPYNEEELLKGMNTCLNLCRPPITSITTQ